MHLHIGPGTEVECSAIPNQGIYILQVNYACTIWSHSIPAVKPVKLKQFGVLLCSIWRTCGNKLLPATLVWGSSTLVQTPRFSPAVWIFSSSMVCGWASACCCPQSVVNQSSLSLAKGTIRTALQSVVSAVAGKSLLCQCIRLSLRPHHLRLVTAAYNKY